MFKGRIASLPDESNPHLQGSSHIFCILTFKKKIIIKKKKSNLGPKIVKMTYTRDIIVVALSFGKKTIPDLPCKD